MSRITFFETPNEFFNWLKANHQHQEELVVGYYKKGTGIPSITWEESVIEAVKFGWIDGIRRKVDENSYSIRFTPRRTPSIWSNKNISIVEALLKEGLMEENGLEAFNKRKEGKSGIYSFEQEIVEFPKSFADTFKRNQKAWEYFQSQPNWYKKAVTHWVITAKKEKTQYKRLQELIDDSNNHLHVKLLRR